MSYEWLKSGLDSETGIPHQSPDFAPAEKHHLRGLIDQVEEALDSRGYFRSEKKRPALIDNLRAVFSRPAFSENEIFFLRGVFSSLDQYSRSAPKGKSGPGLGGRSTDDGLNDE